MVGGGSIRRVWIRQYRWTMDRGGGVGRQRERIIADTLFCAGTVETIKIDVRYLRYSRGGGFHVAPRFGIRGLNYSAYGFLPNEWAPGRYTAQLPLGAMRELLSFPETTDPRISELALQMTV